MTLSWGWVLLVVPTLLGLGAAWHALLNKRDSRSALGWMAVALALPIAGPLAYLLFGINRVRARARRRSRLSLAASEEFCGPDDASLAVPELSDLARAGAVISGMPLRPGNRIAALRNGEQAYPAMLEAIAAAVVSVDLSTYIFENNATGHRFVDALVAARQRGVRVRVLLDGMGEWYSPGAHRRLRRGGLEVRSFNPLRLVPPNLAVNLRNHRKLLVVDGAVAFAGGINIGDRHLLAPPRCKHPVADLHFQLRGSVVADLQRVFADTWRQAGGDLPTVDVKELAADTATGLTGSSLCRVIADGPDETLDQLALVLQSAVSAARRSVRIMTPYFLPPRELLAGLQSAALRGVVVTIVLPERSNLPYVHWATRNLLWELLDREVRVFYQPAPFNHGKLLVIDERYVLVGSANIDPRSLRLNYELGVEVFDPAFGADMSGLFDALVAGSRPVTSAELDGRSLIVRTRDALCWLFSPYL